MDEIEKTVTNISLKNTGEFIKQLCTKTSYKIISEYPTINTIDCEIQKGERCFNYSCGEILSIGSHVKFQHKSYGYQDPFILENTKLKLNAFKGAASINIKLGQGFSSNGELWELESEGFKKQAVYRALLPLTKFNKKPSDFIESLPFKVDSSLRVFGYIKLSITEKPIAIFDYKINGQEYLIIESHQTIRQLDFENALSVILHCFALISGCLIRNEVLILEYTDLIEERVVGFHYRKIEDSISGLSSINPKLFRDSEKSTKQPDYLSSEFFARMINASLDDLRLFRSIKIISESFRYPVEIRASTLSVALETLKNIIIEENEGKINPFKSKKFASKVIQKLRSFITELNDSEFNNKTAVLNKLEQLNQVGNKDSFLLAFKLLEIKLNTDDEICINMRNDFLHGRIPFEDEIMEKDEKDYKLRHIVYKLHFLTTSLIYKYCGYSGYMLNNIKLVDLVHFNKNIKEPLFRKI